MGSNLIWNISHQILNERIDMEAKSLQSIWLPGKLYFGQNQIFERYRTHFISQY
jgi:hypothetical protein